MIRPFDHQWILAVKVCDLLEEVQVDDRVDYPKAVALVGVAV